MTLKAKIRQALDNNDVQAADVLTRIGLERSPNDADLSRLFDEVAGRVFRPGKTRGRLLLIPEWRAGFWADVSHVLGSLLLAEMTGRTPVVHWGIGSRFSNGAEDSWSLYYQPVSDISLDAVSSAAVEGHYPPEWTPNVIASRSEPMRPTRPRGTYGIALLARAELVVVSDAYLGVPDLMPWLLPEDPYFGLSRITVTQSLVGKYLRLQQHLVKAIDLFYNRHLAGRRWLAVHVRGSDKVSEVPDLDAVNAKYVPWIDAYLRERPDSGIFLLTDSEPAVASYQQRYGDRVLMTDSFRVSGTKGIHRSGFDPVHTAEQVILDTYLAARCDAFLGNGASNVSLAVEWLKDWPASTYTLLGPDWRGKRFAV